MAQAPENDVPTSVDQGTTEISQPGNATIESQMVSQPGNQGQSQNDSNTTTNENDNVNDSNNNSNDNDEKSNDLPPKTDVTLILKGTPEYNSFPFTKESDKFYFMASVKASYFKETDRAPIDLCVVIDESSSMSGDRIKLVKDTVIFVLRNLTDKDRFGIVGYGSNAVTRLALTKMDDNGKKQASLIVNNIRAQGMTALCDGLHAGVQMMRNRNKDDANQIASVMLFTDGQANVGATSAQQIVSTITGGSYSSVMAQARPQLQQRNIKMTKKRRVKPQQILQAPVQLPSPPQPQQQQQQQPPPQPQQQVINSTDNTDNKEKNDDEKAKESNIESQPGSNDTTTKTDEGAEDKTLPCTIYTFGFGANHNESLLEALAEWGRGQYTFIENTDTIAEIFAECLGGLISIVGRDLKVKVSGLNGVLLNRCISQVGYKVEQTKPKLEYTISIPDIQSEENRDLVFEITIPKLDAQRDGWPMAQISCEYTNVAKKKSETLSVIGKINRCNENDEIGERNDELDAQCNRIFASEAMDIADKMAEKGDLTNARKVLTDAKSKIQQSQTYQKQKKGYFQYAQNLVSDMDDVTKDLSNKQSYSNAGGKKLKMSKKAHGMQRSVHSSNYASQSSYTNNAKSRMIRSFKQ